MIYGDNPVKLNEREADSKDLLGLGTYTLVPSITAIMQSGNLYVYCTSNPISYSDISGDFIISTAALLVAGGALLFGTLGGLAGNNAANKKGAKGWEKVGYIAGGAVIGGVVGAVAGVIAAPAVVSATGVAGISVTAAGISTVTVGGTLIVPEFVRNAGSFISWVQQTFEKTQQMLTLEQVKQIFAMAEQYGVKITADLSGHVGTAWEMAHIHLGNARIHLAVSKEAIQWIINNLK